MYRIRSWEEHFENHESRKVKGVRWVALPNKHDGKGYRRVAQRPDGVQVFCAWTLILQVASKMPTRGVLADEDGPLDADDLSAMTGFPAEIFEAAFKVLTEPRIGWLEEVAAVDVEVPERAGTERHPAVSRPFPVSPSVAGKTAVEGNGRELNGREREGTPARAKPPVVPASAEVSDAVKVYEAETGLSPPVYDAERIRAEVKDPNLFRETIRRLLSNKTPAKNVGTMLTVYAESEAKKSSGKVQAAEVRLV